MPLVHYLHLLGLPQFPKPFLHCTWTPSSWAEWNQTLALAAQRRGKQLPPLQNAVKPPATPARRREEPWRAGPEERCARKHGHGPRCRELQLEGETRVTTRHFERPSAFPWDADLHPAWTQGRPQAQKILQIFNKQKRSLHKTLPPQRQSHSQRRWSRGARTASSCSDPPRQRDTEDLQESEHNPRYQRKGIGILIRLTLMNKALCPCYLNFWHSIFSIPKKA